VSVDPFDLVRAEEILVGYSARWYDEPLEPLLVEGEFYFPLVNPYTGEEHAEVQIGGKIDCIVFDPRDERVHVLESKTSSEDIRLGSPYWLRTQLSPQLSTYMVGARALGLDPSGIIYDVLARPQQLPLSATPVEARKYTQPTKKNPESRLYANQRDTDETPEEYRQRLRESIVEDPNEYYVRAHVPLLASDEHAAAVDQWQQTEILLENEGLGRFPRNPDSCVKYGATCSYIACCLGQAEIDDPFRFRSVERAHEELTGTPARNLRVLTNSELGASRACSRLHQNRYLKMRRSLVATETQRSGSMVHRGLEGWWLGKKERRSERECVDQAFEFMRRDRPVPAYLPEEAVA